MKKLIWTLFLLTLTCVAQTPEPTRITGFQTNGHNNGRFWTTALSETSKLYFLVGMDDGMAIANSNAKHSYFPDVPFEDIIKGLDRFYQEPENLIFPTTDALQIFTMKVNGATQAEVEARLVELRRGIKRIEELLKKK